MVLVIVLLDMLLLRLWIEDEFVGGECLNLVKIICFNFILEMFLMFNCLLLSG